MSIRVMNAVWEKAPYSEGTLLVLLALADWSNDDGECWPSYAKIAIKSRLTESGVRFCMGRLIREGAIEIISDVTAPGKSRKYSINAEYLTPLVTNPVNTASKPRNSHGFTASRSLRNKEEPSVKATVSKTRKCSRCQGRGIRASISIPGKTVTCECVEVA